MSSSACTSCRHCGQASNPGASSVPQRGQAIEAKARSFVPRYRTLEEGEANGVYTIRLEAEVDETALRRRIERGTTTAPPPTTTPAKAGAAGMLVAAGDKGEGTAAAWETLFRRALEVFLAGSG